MLRMSKLTDYGTIVLAQLAARPGALSTAGEVATATRLGQATVSKLLKSLTRAGLVVSERGPQGGYLLARAPEEISAAQILDALEGPVAITECSAAGGECDLESVCRVGAAWRRINYSIRRALDQISLADLQQQPDATATLNLRHELHVPHVTR